MDKHSSFRQIFPQGAENPPANARYFTGRSYLAPLTANKALNVPLYNVTFEPGCRNNWHSHTGGQILIVTAGRGYYQERGSAARELLPGDVVEIAPDVEHWHGAAPDSWFSHLAVECNPATNRNTWLEPVDDESYAAAVAGAQPSPVRQSQERLPLTDEAARNLAAWQSDETAQLALTDPELAAAVGNFAFDEVRRVGGLSPEERILVTMASAIALGSEPLYRQTVGAALDAGLSPEMVEEVLYHATPYVGFARVEGLLGLKNRLLARRGVALPLKGRATVTRDERLEKGLALQKSLFGEAIDRMYETSPADLLPLQRALSANCFGDYQTRRGLDARQRELLTFAMLVSLGGCESQVKGHIRGNVAAGNDRRVLLGAVMQLLPYIGYPRTLNAVACLEELLPADAR